MIWGVEGCFGVAKLPIAGALATVVTGCGDVGGIEFGSEER